MFFMAFFLYCSLYSYGSTNYFNIFGFWYFSLLKAITKAKENIPFTLKSNNFVVTKVGRAISIERVIKQTNTENEERNKINKLKMINLAESPAIATLENY